MGSGGSSDQSASCSSPRRRPGRREAALSLWLRHDDGVEGWTFVGSANAEKGQPEVGREECVEDGIETAVAVGQTVRDDLEDDQATALTNVIEVDHPKKQHDLEGRPADGEGDNDDDDHPRDTLLVLLAFAHVPLVPDGPRSVCGCRSAPQPQEHVHVEPHDGEEREGQGRGEEEGLVELLIKIITVKCANGSDLTYVVERERRKKIKKQYRTLTKT